MKRLLMGIVWTLLALVSSVHAGELKTIRSITSPVVDTTGTLTGTQHDVLRDQVETIAKDGAQLVLIAVAADKGEHLFDFAQNTFRALRIGSKAKNNGLLIVLSTTDGRVRVHPGYGLEGDIPDARALQMASTISNAYLKASRDPVYAAFAIAVREVRKALPDDLKDRPEKKHEPWGLLFALACFVAFIANLMHPLAGGIVGAAGFAGAGFVNGITGGALIAVALVGFLFGLVARHIVDIISFGGGGGGWSGGGGDAGGAGAEIIGGIIGAIGDAAG